MSVHSTFCFYSYYSNRFNPLKAFTAFPSFTAVRCASRAGMAPVAACTENVCITSCIFANFTFYAAYSTAYSVQYGRHMTACDDHHQTKICSVRRRKLRQTSKFIETARESKDRQASRARGKQSHSPCTHRRWCNLMKTYLEEHLWRVGLSLQREL